MLDSQHAARNQRFQSRLCAALCQAKLKVKQLKLLQAKHVHVNLLEYLHSRVPCCVQYATNSVRCHIGWERPGYIGNKVDKFLQYRLIERLLFCQSSVETMDNVSTMVPMPMLLSIIFIRIIVDCEAPQCIVAEVFFTKDFGFPS
jgi:hypothetical protein